MAEQNVNVEKNRALEQAKAQAAAGGIVGYYLLEWTEVLFQMWDKVGFERQNELVDYNLLKGTHEPT